MDPYLRQRETVAEKLSGSPGFLRRGHKAWLTVAIGLLLVLGFWFVVFQSTWILGSGTGVSGFLETVSSSGSQQHPGTVTISGGGVLEATGNATTAEGFSIEVEPGSYQVAGTLSDGSACFSRTVEVAERGSAEITLTCHRP